jgi:Carbohydrate family 9 binding domain-like/WD domain, G-beta repeat
MPPSQSKSELVLELAKEFVERYRKGERPPLSEYIDLHPELAADINEVRARRISSLERFARFARLAWRNKGIAAALGVIGLLFLVAAIASSVANTGEGSAVLSGHDGGVRDAAFDPAGGRIASAGKDHTIRVSGDHTVRILNNTVTLAVRAQPKDAYVPPKGYVAYRAVGKRGEAIRIDGKLDEEAWKAAPWTDDFVDIQGEDRIKPRFRTRVKMLWDDNYLYIGAEMEEPHVQGTFTKRDSYIFHEDNDFEVFINPDGNNHNYAELEMNALNTVWDLRLKKPYRDKGRAEDAWDIPGLKTAVHVDGTINNPRDIDKGWSVEIAIPWEITKALNDKPGKPPRDGDHWRINFSRVQWRYDVVDAQYVRRKERREDNWVWSPQWAVDMHRPEMWGYVQFSTAQPGTAKFRPDPSGRARHVLQRIYAAQSAFHAKNKRYARDLTHLDLGGLRFDGLVGPPILETGNGGYRATVELRRPDGATPSWRIREDSLVEPVEKENRRDQCERESRYPRNSLFDIPLWQ